MKDKRKKPVPLPRQFESYDDAGDFWGRNDTTNYREHLTPVKATTEFRKRRFEIEVEPELAELLQRRAKRVRKPVRKLVADLLRQSLCA
jgi:hypothetical protein